MNIVITGITVKKMVQYLEAARQQTSRAKTLYVQRFGDASAGAAEFDAEIGKINAAINEVQVGAQLSLLKAKEIELPEGQQPAKGKQ